MVPFCSFPDPLFSVFPKKEFSSLIKSGALLWRLSLCQTVRKCEFLNENVSRYHLNLMVTDGHQTSGPCFGPLRRSISCNSRKFPVLKPNCNCIGTEPVSEPGRMAIFELKPRRQVFRTVRSPCAGVRKLQNTCGAQESFKTQF